MDLLAVLVERHVLLVSVSGRLAGQVVLVEWETVLGPGHHRLRQPGHRAVQVQLLVSLLDYLYVRMYGRDSYEICDL